MKRENGPIKKKKRENGVKNNNFKEKMKIKYIKREKERERKDRFHNP